MDVLEKYAAKKKLISGLIKTAVNIRNLTKAVRAMRGRGEIIRKAERIPSVTNPSAERMGLPSVQMAASPPRKAAFSQIDRMQGDYDKIRKLPQGLRPDMFEGANLKNLPVPFYLQGAKKHVSQPTTGKVFQPKGGLTRSMNQLGTKVDQMRRQGRTLGTDDKQLRLFEGGYATNPDSQRATNLFGLRHEGAELAAMRKNPKGYMFSGHFGPKPPINDLNVAATFKGSTGDELRKQWRTIREPEMQSLSEVIYPKANMSKFDPRRFLSPKQYQEQKAQHDRLMNLGKPGQRMNRHAIKKIDNLYEDAAKRNTFASLRAQGRDGDATNFGLFLKRYPKATRPLYEAARTAELGGEGMGTVYRTLKRRWGDIPTTTKNRAARSAAGTVGALTAGQQVHRSFGGTK